jgi:thiamine monophosphate kinase
VGAHLETGELPLPPGYGALCEALDLDATTLPILGGEDYALLFSLPPGEAPPAALGCTRIGAINDSGLCTWDRGGRQEPLPEEGWDHLDP